MLGLNEQQRAEGDSSGLAGENAPGWAHDRLKTRAGFIAGGLSGKMVLTPAGMSWLPRIPQPLTEQEVSHLLVILTAY
ncbi:hypothetical protein KCP69_25710 [Salmonella enterica subsp. enterica]|nr:hypothetical protein KCP69_25710 [Salmonella enterica subsp. enterica]